MLLPVFSDHRLLQDRLEAGPSSFSNMITYYSILGVSEDASLGEIVAAYRREMTKCHPDLSGASHANTRQARLLNKAKDILSDPIKRQKYDSLLKDKRAKNTGFQEKNKDEKGKRNSMNVKLRRGPSSMSFLILGLISSVGGFLVAIVMLKPIAPSTNVDASNKLEMMEKRLVELQDHARKIEQSSNALLRDNQRLKEEIASLKRAGAPQDLPTANSPIEETVSDPQVTGTAQAERPITPLQSADLLESPSIAEATSWFDTRNWSLSAGRQSRKGRLYGIGKNMEYVVIQTIDSKEEFLKLALDSLSDEDRQFCNDAFMSEPESMLLTTKKDLSIYEGMGYQKLQDVFVKYSLELLPIGDHETAAQRNELLLKARTRVSNQLTGVNLKFPAIVHDVVSKQKQGTKRLVVVPCSSLYPDIGFSHELQFWFSSEDIKKLDKGTVVWISGEIASTTQRVLMKTTLKFATADFLLQVPNKDRKLTVTSGIELPFYVISIKPTSEDETVELLNRFRTKTSTSQ